MNPYPFDRTVCACRLCTINCEHIPGGSLPLIFRASPLSLGYDNITKFANECLLASDGGKVAMRDGRVVSLPTLVPANGPDGFCRFLSAGRCTIHAVSPYGCAYIDAHMSESEYRHRADTLSARLLEDQKQEGIYSKLTTALRSKGQTAPPLETRRYHLAKAIRKEGLTSV